MRVVWRLLLLVVALVLIVFAVSNRAPVTLGMWPLSELVEVPLYLVVIGALAIGFVLGELAAWIGGRHWRHEARQSRRRIVALENELDAAETRGGSHVVPTDAAASERARLAR